jgi:hypothetical protein
MERFNLLNMYFLTGIAEKAAIQRSEQDLLRNELMEKKI